MKPLIRWSIDHHGIVIALSVLLLAAGIWTARDMPVDVSPDLTAPTVTILTEARGMAPAEVESLVTYPIETALNGAPGVRRVRSSTQVGFSIVWCEFGWGSDVLIARQVVGERLRTLADVLPAEIEPPVLAPISSIMGEIMFHTGVAARAIDAVDRLIARVPGRLSLVAIVGGTIFSSLSGSTIANTAMLGSTLLPEMYKRGYKPSISIGPIVATGGLAMLIPP